MNKGQSQNESFLHRSASFATHGSRTGKNLLGWGEQEVLKPDQQREALIARLDQVTALIIALKEELKITLPRKEFQEKTEALQGYREEVRAIQLQLRDAGLSKPKKHIDMGECIIKLMKERMTKPQWECVLKEALERYKVANGHAYMGDEYK